LSKFAPACQRAVAEACAALRANAETLVALEMQWPRGPLTDTVALALTGAIERAVEILLRAQAEADRIEARYSDADLLRLIRAHGLEPAAAVEPAPPGLEPGGA
jgi:hypothetical protein